MARPSEYEIRTDGRTVWVDRGAYTIGRFGPMGVDVHSDDATRCLDCTHGPTGRPEWHRFQAGMARHHRILVPGSFMPDWLRGWLGGLVGYLSSHRLPGGNDDERRPQRRPQRRSAAGP